MHYFGIDNLILFICKKWTKVSIDYRERLKIISFIFIYIEKLPFVQLKTRNNSYKQDVFKNRKYRGSLKK